MSERAHAEGKEEGGGGLVQWEGCQKKGGGGGAGERGRRGKKGGNVAKQMNQTSSGDKSRAEPNDFRQLPLERQIGF